MHIHIVSRDYQSDQILARLARELSGEPGYTIADRPDPEADVNYFFPYLEWDRFRDFTATKTAAWFTHQDADRAEKVRIWNDTAAAVDLRLTSAALYVPELEAFGDAALVTPPLDRNKFTLKPTPAEPSEMRVIGTSGFVYPGGRKGEALIKRLAEDRPDLAIVASGQGWPVQTAMLEWGDMQAFYHRLDVYVCTSTIEGIGYGPLEAMACGVPVVIPRGVGVFDELPALENLHRYKAGDYANFADAVNAALETLNAGGYNPDSLRGATSRFTKKVWYDSHNAAFEQMLHGAPPVGELPSWAGRACAYYVAYGDPARECAERAIKSWKRYMPEVPVVFVGDAPLNVGEDVYIEHNDDDIGARSVKTKIYDVCPPEFDYVLYLDADTEIVSPDVRFFFDLLEDGWELVFCMNPAKYVLAAEMKRPDNGPECEETFAVMGTDEILQLNGGVFAFRRNDRTAYLMRQWHAEWNRYGARDQAALDRALYAAPVRTCVLGNEWNTITRYIDASRTAGVLHYPMQARRWRGRINGRLDGSEAWAAVHPTGKAGGQ